MTKKTPKTARTSAYQPYLVALGIVTVVASFGLGVRTAGDVHPIRATLAEDSILKGDMNGDAQLTVEDAIAILEVAQGYEQATVDQLRADPNDDGQLTVDDAVRLLHDIASR